MKSLDGEATNEGITLSKPSPQTSSQSVWSWVGFVAPLVFAVLLVVSLLVALHGAIVNVDGIYTSQVARNLLEGKGYSTSELPLYEVDAYYQSGLLSNGPPWPNNLEFPFAVAVKIPFIALSGGSYFASTTLPSVLFYFATGVALYFLTFRLFARRSAAAIAMLLFFTNPISLVSAIDQKDLSLDMLLFVLSLLVLITILRSERPTFRWLALLGLLIGISFLTRFTEGVFVGIAVMPLIYSRVSKFGWIDRKRATLLVLTVPFVALVVISPFLDYNQIVFGSPVASGNFALQLVASTPLDKYMNPWWQFNYPPIAFNVIAFAETQFPAIQAKASIYLYAFLLDILFVGYLPIGGTMWWWSAVGYLGLRTFGRSGRRGTSTDVAPLSRSIFLIVLFCIFANGITLAPFSGNIEYAEFLIPGLALLAGGGIVLFLDDFVRWRANRALNFFRSRQSSESSRARGWLALFGGPKWIRAERAALVTGLALLCALPASYGAGVIPGPAPIAHASAEWLTNHDPAALAVVKALTPPGTIDLTPEPWNVVWFDDRDALPLPPYPDDVYLMIEEDHLNISTVYIADIDSSFLNSVAAPYPYASYRYFTNYGESMAGFSVAYRGNTSYGPDEVLVRNSLPIPDMLNSSSILFGNSSNATHLDWGWSAPSVLGKVPVNWATVPGGINVPLVPDTTYYGCGAAVYVEGTCLPKLSYSLATPIPNGSLIPSSTTWPEAEVTFFVGSHTPTVLTIQLYSPIPNQWIRVIANANLLIDNQPGVMLGEAELPSKDVWYNLTFEIPQSVLGVGLNVLDFQFSGSQYQYTNSFGWPVSNFAAFGSITFS